MLLAKDHKPITELLITNYCFWRERGGASKYFMLSKLYAVAHTVFDFSLPCKLRLHHKCCHDHNENFKRFIVFWLKSLVDDFCGWWLRIIHDLCLGLPLAVTS